MREIDEHRLLRTLKDAAQIVKRLHLPINSTYYFSMNPRPERAR
jgi:hypothetical protein